MNKDGRVQFKVNFYNDEDVITFQSKEEAEAKRKELLIERINNATYNIDDIGKDYCKDVLSTPEMKDIITNRKEYLKQLSREKAIKEASDAIEKYTKILQENA